MENPDRLTSHTVPMQEGDVASVDRRHHQEMQDEEESRRQRSARQREGWEAERRALQDRLVLQERQALETQHALLEELARERARQRREDEHRQQGYAREDERQEERQEDERQEDEQLGYQSKLTLVFEAQQPAEADTAAATEAVAAATEAGASEAAAEPEAMLEEEQLIRHADVAAALPGHSRKVEERQEVQEEARHADAAALASHCQEVQAKKEEDERRHTEATVALAHGTDRADAAPVHTSAEQPSPTKMQPYKADSPAMSPILDTLDASGHETEYSSDTTGAGASRERVRARNAKGELFTVPPPPRLGATGEVSRGAPPPPMWSPPVSIPVRRFGGSDAPVRFGGSDAPEASARFSGGTLLGVPGPSICEPVGPQHRPALPWRRSPMEIDLQQCLQPAKSVQHWLPPKLTGGISSDSSPGRPKPAVCPPPPSLCNNVGFAEQPEPEETAFCTAGSKRLHLSDDGAPVAAALTAELLEELKLKRHASEVMTDQLTDMRQAIAGLQNATAATAASYGSAIAIRSLVPAEEAAAAAKQALDPASPKPGSSSREEEAGETTKVVEEQLEDDRTMLQELQELRATLEREQAFFREALNPEAMQKQVEAALAAAMSAQEPPAAVASPVAAAKEAAEALAQRAEEEYSSPRGSDISSSSVNLPAAMAGSRADMKAEVRIAVEEQRTKVLEEATRSMTEAVHSEVAEAMSPMKAQMEDVRRSCAEDIARAKAGEDEARKALAVEMARFCETEELRAQALAVELARFRKTEEEARLASEKAEQRQQEQVQETMAMMETQAKHLEAKRCKEEKAARDRLHKTEEQHRYAREEKRRLEKELQKQREEELLRVQREMKLQLELKAEQRELQWKAEHRELEMKAEMKEMRWQADWQAVSQLEASDLLRPTPSEKHRGSPGREALAGGDSLASGGSSGRLQRSCSRVREVLLDHIAASQEKTICEEEAAMTSGHLSCRSSTSLRAAQPFSQRSAKSRSDARLAEKVAADLSEPQPAGRRGNQRPASAPRAGRQGGSRAVQGQSTALGPRKRPWSAGSVRSTVASTASLDQGAMSYKRVASRSSQWYDMHRAQAQAAVPAAQTMYDKGQGRLHRGYTGHKSASARPAEVASAYPEVSQIASIE